MQGRRRFLCETWPVLSLAGLFSVNNGMDWDHILDDLIGELNPEFVHNEYIIAIKYSDKYGLEHIIRGDDLRFFLRHPEKFGAREVQVILDISRIRRLMYNAIAEFLLDLNERVANTSNLR